MESERSFGEFSDLDDLARSLGELLETDLRAATELLEGAARWLTLNATEIVEPRSGAEAPQVVTLLIAELMACSRGIQDATGRLTLLAGRRGSGQGAAPSILDALSLRGAGAPPDHG